MKWEKLGRVFVASGHAPWAQSHAYLPTVLPMGDDRLRVFVSFLDSDRVGRLGWVDVSADDPTQVLDVATKPALDVGEPGRFDDNGVTPLSVFRREGRTWLYYAGWQLGVRLRYYLFTGLATSGDDGATFERHAAVPVLDRTHAEPTLRTGGFFEPFDRGVRAWYMAGQTWIPSAGRLMPSYDMKYAESPDGIEWPAEGEVCLAAHPPEVLGYGRPHISHDRDLARMWYSIRYRDRGYRVGYAESGDGGRSWTRLDDLAGIDVSASGWDSEMIGYTWIQPTRAGLWMFYNGNDYGRTGFGVARADS